MGDKEDGHGFEGALDKDMLVTDPEEAADFVKSTRCDALAVAIGTSHGSVGQWLNTSATPLEKRNFVEFVQCLEEFEGRHGLTPANRSADDVSGTINLALGPTIKCSLKFLV